MNAPRPGSLRRALDGIDEPAMFFVRDDDAGWADDRLAALLDLADGVAMPIDLAVIPGALSDALQAELCARFDCGGGRIGLHQHGYVHANHEPEGRKCEFGLARDLQARCRDVMAGRDRLASAFAGRLDPIFTPPWNRCAADLPPLLAALGFAALSRDASAPAQAAIPELPVDVDWCRHWRGAAGDPTAAAAAVEADLARRVRPGATIGLMLHHAAMDSAQLAALRALLVALRQHPNACCVSMRDALERAVAPCGAAG